MTEREQDLPHNIEAEQQLLGAILTNPEALQRVSDFKSEWMYEPVHARLLDAARKREAAGLPFHAVALKDDFRDDEGLIELGGPGYLARLSGAAIHVAAVADYAQIVREHWARRHSIEALQETAADLQGLGLSSKEEIEKSLYEAQNAVAQAIAAGETKPLVRTWLNTMTEGLQQIIDARNADGVVGISSGYPSLDLQIGGFAPGDMIVLAGRPSMGKTAIALEIAWRVAKRGEGVLFGSLEMMGAQLVPRFISSMLAAKGVEIPYFAIRTGRLDDDQMRKVVETIKEFEALPFQVAEKDCRSMQRLRAAALKAKTFIGVPLGLIVVDYLQLIEDPTTPNDYQRVSRASNAVKSLGVDLGVPVLVLSQLNRGVEMREPPMPRLSDLRESGRIEEDADLIMMAYRAEYYLQKQIEETDRNDIDRLADLHAAMQAERNNLRLLIPKNRGGATGSCDLKFFPPFNRVVDPRDAT